MRSGTGWPLTGRDRELRLIFEALARTGGVVLAGAAGVGKSRLAREAAGSEPRWLVASDSAREIPLGAFASLLRPDEEAVGDLSMLHAAAAALRGNHDQLLVVDDAHLLDSVSATLLHQLAAERAVRIVVTVRTGEPAPDAVTALWKDGLLEGLEVAPLNEQTTGSLVEAALGSLVDGSSRRRLFAVTQGNVLWLRHLVDGERAAGRLAWQGEEWRWAGDPRISSALRDLIEARIGRLSEPLRHLLELLAFGEPLGVDLLTLLVGHATTEEAALRGLVTVTPTGRRWDVRLAHPLYGEAVRSRADALLARHRRGELATALDTSGARRLGDAVRRAVLMLDSDLPVDVTLLTTAANEAAALTDLALAERLARSARDGGGGFPAQLALGMVHMWRAAGEAAETELAAALALADTEEERLQAGLPRVGNLFFVLGRAEEADALRAWLDAAVTAERSHLDLIAARSMTDWARARGGEALAFAALVLDSADVSDWTVTWATMSTTNVLSRQGRITELADAAARGHAVARRPETAVLRLYMSYFEVAAYGLVGWPALGRHRVDELRGPDPRTAEMVGLLEGRIALDTGRVRTAVRLYGDYRTAFRGDRTWTTHFEIALAQALAASGDLPGARGALARAEAARYPALRVVEPDLELARAWIAAAEGAVSLAVDHAREAAEAAAASEQWAVEVVARHTAVCFGGPEQAARLGELAERLEGPRASAAAAHAAALAAKDADGLLTVSHELEGCELLLPAADAAAQAAAVHRDRGRVARAVPAARATALAERCEGARTPALLLAACPLPVSAREREVAMLAGAGRSNSEIADRLHVSVRTVEGHVYRACTRLGLADRAALAALVTSNAGRDT